MSAYFAKDQTRYIWTGKDRACRPVAHVPEPSKSHEIGLVGGSGTEESRTPEASASGEPQHSDIMKRAVVIKSLYIPCPNEYDGREDSDFGYFILLESEEIKSRHLLHASYSSFPSFLGTRSTFSSVY